ncbi:hypothetical protein [Marinicella meishanensis]|uniref:hypothetical protein n=1 Tax=Marinicella meishanensis TaxID=2873263 RepID=UPI001CBF1BD3|nr:hypothetical protein [Marinicella sp. NBU2979]
MKRKVILVTSLLTTSLAATLVSAADDQKPSESVTPSMFVEQVGGPVTPHVVNIDLRKMPVARAWQPGDPIKEVPRRHFTPDDEKSPAMVDIEADVLAERQTNFPTSSNRVFTTPILNQDGQGFSGVNPPDPVSDIGKNYIIQSINGGGGALFEILDKNTGATVAGPIAMESLGSGQCASGLGDPIILYDEDAERWFMQEFSNSGNFMCFYISQTDDPVGGGWFHYGFSDTQFPDYPHFGIWSDAYYGGANNSTRPIYAFDRENMLLGAAARPMQKFSLVSLAGYGFQAAAPADWDMWPGTNAPPAGAPGIIMRHVDEEAHSNYTNRPGVDILEIIEFTVDWDTPANSAINTVSVDFSDFNSCFLDFTTFATVPQPGSGARLDAIREVILNRLQYINFGSHEALVGVLPTNITNGCSPVQAGLRWFELRRVGGLGGTWDLHQEGTYADTTDATENRLVAGISMDSSGNIAMAHSITDTDGSTPISASLKYTGRMAGDTLGVMSQTETDLVIGSGANTSGRWGDYASMSVDPVDGCTFVFTGEYQTGANWSTRVSTMKFDACGDPGFTLSSSDNNLEVCNATGPAMETSTVNIGAVSGFTGNVDLSFSPALPAGINGVFSANPVAVGGSFDADFTIADTVAGGDYVATILGESAPADDRTLDINISVVDAVPGAAALTSPPDAATGVSGSAVAYSWGAVAGASSYTIEISDDPGFSNIIESATVGTNSFTATVGLMSDTQYYWRVTTDNICGTGATSPTFSFTTSTELCFVINQAITDNNPPGDDFGFSVGDSGTIDTMTVDMDVSHTWVGDLIFTLTKDGGPSVILMDRPGFTGTGFGCGNDDVDAIFDDASGTPVESECAATPPAIGGVVSPEQALAGFNGVELSGNWTINVSDNAGFDTGNMNEICLIPVISGPVCDPAPPVGDPDVIWFNGFQCVQSP